MHRKIVNLMIALSVLAVISQNGCKANKETGVWEKVPITNGFPGRDSPAATAHAGKLWLTGGWITNNLTLNDVWSSPDGKDWTRVKDNDETGFPKRALHCMVSHKGRLWIIGGARRPLAALSDVYSSSDGSSWRVEKPDDTSSFAGRGMHSCISFKDRLWVIGGMTVLPDKKQAFADDVWSSSDGKSWKHESDAPFLARYNPAVLVFNDRMWVIGGATDGQSEDVWSSLDGKTWEPEKQSTPGIFPKSSHAAIGFNSSLWVLGGSTNIKENISGTKSPSYKTWTSSEVWISKNGRDWQRQTTRDGSSIPSRNRSRVMSIGDRLFFIGGTGYNLDGSACWSCNDVWIYKR